MTAEEYIKALHMEPLTDEGGWFAPNWRSKDDTTVSVIYYLLHQGEISRWHQLKSNEIWTWHDGGALEMTQGGTAHTPTAERTLRIDQAHPIAVVPELEWQTTKVIEGDFVLVSCVVAPAFRDEDCYLPHPPIEEELR